MENVNFFCSDELMELWQLRCQMAKETLEELGKWMTMVEQVFCVWLEGEIFQKKGLELQLIEWLFELRGVVRVRGAKLF
jgi:hypothetical protein